MSEAHPRGRDAERPTQIPRRGWQDIFKRVWREIGDDNASIVAAGVALFALLAIFPALIALVSIYGLVSSPGEVAQHIDTIRGVVPGQAAEIFTDRLREIANQQDSAKGLGLLVGIGVALWSARRGVVALMGALNIAYEEDEDRGFFHRLLLSLAFTLGGVLSVVLILALAIAVPVVIEFLGSGSVVDTILLLLRWAALWLFVALGLSVLYRWAPDRARAKWRWITPGSAVAASVWLIGSLLFSLYVQNFGNFGETYGALGGVIVTVMWFHLSAFVIVIGAELNAEMEHQTRMDSTTGPDRPMGRRGAYVADTIGKRMD